MSFWPYVLTSWISMLPGAFLYISLGHAGRVAASGSERTPAEWVLLGAGLLATVAVTAYVTRLARQGIARQEALARGPAETEAAPTNGRDTSGPPATPTAPRG